MSHKTKVHGHVEQLSFLSNFNLEMYLDIAKDLVLKLKTKLAPL